MTVPVPHQQGRQRAALLQRPMDVAAAVAAVRALVPPALSNLTCNRGAPGRHCQDQAVPTRLEPLQGSIQSVRCYIEDCTIHTSLIMHPATGRVHFFCFLNAYNKVFLGKG